jgi:hypothetical protein
MSAEKRRADRLMLTIPLQVLGTDPAGHPFREDARTLTLNRHGARIQLSRPLRAGQTVRLINPLARMEADFRVVGPVAPPSEHGGEWGVECLDQTKNMWGIQFPPPADQQASDANALLECRKCHTVALQRLSLVEADVLQAAGLLARQCPICASVSPWGHPEKQIAMDCPPSAAVMAAGVQGAAAADSQARPQRQHPRACLQLPVRVRDFYGRVEITKTENVSKSGLCFGSEKDYQVGEAILVVCPYSNVSHNIEVRACIVRRQNLEGTDRRIYGAGYRGQSA